MNLDRVPHHSVNSVNFSIYSSEEIKKLSILEVTNVKTFDVLGHPCPGGLYDTALGPTDRDELCTTCGLNSIYCPGHLGHITLPLPIFNPVFIRNLYQLLRGSCFSCHRLISPPAIVQLTLAQLQALEYGFIGLVQELEETAMDILTTNTGSIPALEVASRVKEKLKSFVDDALSGLDLTEAKSNAQVKNVVECQHRIVKHFIKDCLMGGGRKCPFCGCLKRRIMLRNNSRFVFTAANAKNIKINKSTPSDRQGEIEEFETLDEDGINQNEENQKEAFETQTYLTPLEARKHLHHLWENEQDILQHLFGVLNIARNSHKSSMDIFFLDAIVVPPSRFRPISVVRGRKYENPQTASLNKVLQDCLILRNILKILKIKEAKDISSETDLVEDDVKPLLEKIGGKTPAEKFHNAWNQLQLHVNCTVDSDMDRISTDKIPGVKQILEKKEGLFRKHMMGKRVNYAARSVISPDPYIMVDEVGIPTVFATKLTYPQPVTPWNVRELRQAVINGPDVHPGAVRVQNDDGSIVKLSATNEVQRQAIAKQLLRPSPSCRGKIRGCKLVYRHLQSGDALLLNRQPTLHKPSIMAHKARVLPGEKTLRLHYANCKSYNADFDGDEMNAHFPQSELARAEAYNIASVNYQYLVPKDGTPLSGLIQDHVIAGSLLTMRGRFFTRDDYHELVFGALTYVQKPIKLLNPAILKPVSLWSGKQIVSTVIINIIPEGKPPPCVEGKSKISSKNWQTKSAREWEVGGTLLRDDDMSESQVIIRNGELLSGVLDKAHYGATPFGLIHCCYELYGGQTSTLLLTSFARLFTHFLQLHTGFTLGIEDILLTPKANKRRKRIMKSVKKVGDEVVAEALGLIDSTNELKEKFQEAHLSKDDRMLKQVDMVMKIQTDKFNNEINKVCIPNGLLKKFPANNLQLMVQSGAKGATVNAMQISCLLGQIELEGRRVPLMMSGRTLPSFLSYDTSPRAGGFIDGRFLTGIRPQEYFFHCMAGREGLVDTAVKTSRSGYLQRCLIKHLEGIVINYDLTARDSDGSVIQFQYGEDSLDIQKMQLLKENQISFLVKNYEAVINKEQLKIALKNTHLDDIYQLRKSIQKWKRKNRKGKNQNCSGFQVFANENLEDFRQQYPGKNPKTQREIAKEKLFEAWYNLNKKVKRKYNKQCNKCPDPVPSLLRPDTNFGAVSEKLDSIIENYISRNPDGLLYESSDVNDNFSSSGRFLSTTTFKNMMFQKIMKSLVEPGEAVGLLAAQSVGEPSTQMTLNTFHFAGRGEMNVTLGIPRMREILMVASSNIATPSMDLPLLPMPDIEERAEKLRKKLTSVNLSQVLESVSIKESLSVKNKWDGFRSYHIRFLFLPHKAYKSDLFATPARILHYMESFFFKKLIEAIKKKLIFFTSSKLVSSHASRSKVMASEENGENTSKEFVDAFNEDIVTSDEGEGDGDTTSAKFKSRHDQELEYEEPEDEEKIENHSEDEEFEDELEYSEVKEEFESEEQKAHAAEIQQHCIMLQKKRRKELKAQKPMRIHAVKCIHHWIFDYDFDTSKEEWCEVILQLSLSNAKLDMSSLLEEEAKKAVVHECPQIKRVFIVRDLHSTYGNRKMLKTEGVNVMEMFKYDDILDLKRLYTNDIHAIAKTYGIEAASRAIVKEIKNVFAVYGIEVDPRHLLLIADYMTFDGTYKACNRIGMESNASPLQQMTFETTMHFLKSATLSGHQDNLKSPSSRLVLGHIVNGGTGCFDLLQPRISLSKAAAYKSF